MYFVESRHPPIAVQHPHVSRYNAERTATAFSCKPLVFLLPRAAWSRAGKNLSLVQDDSYVFGPISPQRGQALKAGVGDVGIGVIARPVESVCGLAGQRRLKCPR